MSLIYIIFLILRRVFRALESVFSLPLGNSVRIGRTAHAFDRLDPGLERGAQLGEAVTLRWRVCDNGVPDDCAVGCDRDRICVAGAAGLQLLAALGRRDLGEQHPGGLEVAL